MYIIQENKIFTITIAIILSTSSVFSGNLGVSLDELLVNIENSAKNDGGSLEIKKSSVVKTRCLATKQKK